MTTIFENLHLIHGSNRGIQKNVFIIVEAWDYQLKAT